LLYFICVCYYIPVFTLISISGLPFLQASLDYTEQRGNQYLSIPYIMSAVMAPFCGFAVDKVGKKPLWLAITSGMLVASYAVLLFGLHIGLPNTGVVVFAVVLLGVSYSVCASSLWPCVALLVSDDRVGTAYAIMNSIQNGGLAIAGLVAGVLATNCSGSVRDCNTRPLLFLILVAVASTVLSIILMFYDWSHGSILASKSIKVPDKTETDTGERDPLLQKKSIN